MDIVIISHFCEDFSKLDNDRFFYLAKMLSHENDVEIITSSFRHTTKKHRRTPVASWPFKITFIEEPGYRKNVCLKRFYSHYVWGKNVGRYIRSRKKPDVVYCAVPSLTGPNQAARYCGDHNVHFVIDVQDLWPEAFQMVMNIPIISRIAFTPFTNFVNNIYKRADAICAVSDTYCRRALKVNTKCKDAATVYLGTELEFFDKCAAEKPIFEKKPNEIWLGYCGTLGSSYDLTCIMDALKILDDDRLQFVIMGDGPKKYEFEEYAQKQGIKAVFTGRLPYSQMCSLLSVCDIVVNPIVHMAAQSIINKHADYAASGKPVLSTQENKEYRTLVEQYKMGLNCLNNDSYDVSRKLKYLLDHKDIREQMGLNARKCAEERFDRSVTYKRIKNIIMEFGHV